MSKNMTLIVKMTIDDPFLDEVKSELLKLHKSTIELDKGCIQYDIHKVIDDKNSFTLIEKWEDANSLEEHKQKDHFINFMKKTDGKIKNFEANMLNKIKG